MKLSFSTKGWHGRSFEELCETAKELRFSGIELHNIKNKLFTGSDSAFNDYATAATLRKLYEMKISIPCIDSICDPADTEKAEEAMAELKECIRIAQNLHIPYIRVHASAHGDNDIENVKSFISDILPIAEEAGVDILLETSGLFSDAKVLRDMLDSFASDSLSALWDVYSSYFMAGQSPETTIETLGAYVKHIHIKDASRIDGKISYCLMGEGELPINELICALRSVNYNGFISLEWDPKWCEEIDDLEIVLSQFESFMSQFSDTSRSDTSLYYNKAHTGRYVWKKELLMISPFRRCLTVW